MKMTKLMLALGIAGAVMVGLPRSTVADYAAPHVEVSGTPGTIAFWAMDSLNVGNDKLVASGTLEPNMFLRPKPTIDFPNRGVEIIDPSTNGVGYAGGDAAFGTCLYFPPDLGDAAGNFCYTEVFNANLTGLDPRWVTYKGWTKEAPDWTSSRWPVRTLLDQYVNFFWTIVDTGYVLRLWDDGVNGGAPVDYAIPVTGTPGWASTNWHHYELRFENIGGAQTVKVLINDVLEFTHVYAGAMGVTTKSGHRFGTRSNGNNLFKGWMDDLVIIFNNPDVLPEDRSYNDFVNLWLLDAASGETNGTLDIDLDGMNNYEEWAYGGNPYAPDAEKLPQITADENGLQVVHTRLRTQLDNDLTNSVLTSTFLPGAWADFDAGDADSTELVKVESGYYETVTSQVSTVTHDAKFLTYNLEVGPQSVTPLDIPCFYAIPLAATTPSIDGVLSAAEYDDAFYENIQWPEIGSNGCGQLNYNAPTSHADFSVEKYIKWDATYLYVLFDATDETNVFTEGTNPYPFDHIGFAIDPSRLAVANTDAVFHEMGVRITNGVMDTLIKSNWNEDLFPTNGVFASSTNATGWTLECAFKWSDLGVVPVQGQKHGMATICCDNDTGGNRDTFLYDVGAPDTGVIGKPEIYAVVQLGPEL